MVALDVAVKKPRSIGVTTATTAQIAQRERDLTASPRGTVTLRKPRNRRLVPTPLPPLPESQSWGECPACGKEISVVVEGADMKPKAIIHAMPMCDVFFQMDGGDYLRWVRETREIAAGTRGEA